MQPIKSIRDALSANAIDIISDAILWFDSALRIVDTNKAFLNYVSAQSTKSIKGQHLNSFLAYEDQWDALWPLIEQQKEVTSALSMLNTEAKVTGTFRRSSLEHDQIGILILTNLDSDTIDGVMDDMMLQSIIDLSPAQF